MPIRTSSRPRCAERFAPSGSSARIRSSPTPTSASSGSRSSRWIFSSCRTASTRRRRRSIADLVLPAAMWGEKEGTFTNSERRVSKVNRAVDPPGEARSDFDIFLAVAAALGCREELFPGWTTPADAFDEWKRVSRPAACATTRACRTTRSSATAACNGRVPKTARSGRLSPPLCGRRVPDRRRQGAPDSHRVGALPRAAQTRLSPDPEHGPHGRALAHAHQDRPRADSRLALAVGVGRSQSARRAARERQALRSRRRGFAARPDPQPASLA